MSLFCWLTLDHAIAFRPLEWGALQSAYVGLFEVAVGWGVVVVLGHIIWNIKYFNEYIAMITYI